MDLSVLNPDVILRTVSMTDIPTLLATSETCRELYSLYSLIMSTRSLWVALIADVQRRIPLHISDVGSLQSLSVNALVNILIRTLRGPKTWAAPPRSRHGLKTWTMPVVSRQLTLRPKKPFSSLGATLLGDGQHLLIRKSGSNLECWNIAQKRLVWTYSPHGVNAQWANIINNLEYGEETVKPGEIVNLIICMTIFDGRRQLIEIVKLNLATGRSELLQSMEAPLHLFYCFYRPMICHDWALVSLKLAHAIFLLNWRTGRHVEISPSNVLRPPMNALPPFIMGAADHESLWDATLIPGHLITLATEHHDIYLSIWDENSFDWQSGPALSRQTDAHPLIRTKIDLPGERKARQLRIHAHAHPLHDKTYVLWTIATSELKRTGELHGSSTAIKYMLELDPSPVLEKPGCVWRRKSIAVSLGPTAMTELNRGFLSIAKGGVSFSGHTLASCSATHPPAHTVISLKKLPYYGRISGAFQFPEALHLAPYSGALTYVRDDEIVVEYHD
ncbi:hypothetical protein DXG01_006901 [Tephrocybe rancida]|nr:hypothetical protein DXG01_006901 [Tephrocybe rancida]